MTAEATKLLREALELPTDVRAAVAASLIRSLDDTVESDVEAAWATEIAKRIRDLDSGALETVPWSEARQQILADDDAAPG